ncbi:hypothetical protein HK405_004991, partial [Cladochytrium tenue]
MMTSAIPRHDSTTTSSAVPSSSSSAASSSSWFKTRLYSFWSSTSASGSSSSSSPSSSAPTTPTPAASLLQPQSTQSLDSPTRDPAVVQPGRRSAQERERAPKPPKRRGKVPAQRSAPSIPSVAPSPAAPPVIALASAADRLRPPSPLRQNPTANAISGRSASPFRSLERSLSRSTPFASRSASPALSVSSMVAAKHLSRLTDAQVAELAAQVSVEMLRRRTPAGSVVAYYERIGLGPGQTGATTSRLASLNQDKFLLLASDLDAEALNRDIPGIDITGARVRSLSRNPTATSSTAASPFLRFGPNNPAAAEAAAAAAASLELPPPAVAPTATVAAAGALGSPLLRSNSMASLHSTKSLPRHLSGPADQTPEEERAALRARIAVLADASLRALLADARTELDARRRSGDLSGPTPAGDGKGRRHQGMLLASGDGDDDAAALPPLQPAGTTVPGSAPAAEQEQRSYYWSFGGDGAVDRSPSLSQPSPTPRTLAQEREDLLRAVPTPELAALVEDAAAEAETRPPPPPPSAPSAPAAASATAAPSVDGAGGTNSGSMPRKKKADSANVAAWRTRIANLTDDQLAEVTTDVFDEITRRKEKK